MKTMRRRRPTKRPSAREHALLGVCLLGLLAGGGALWHRERELGAAQLRRERYHQAKWEAERAQERVRLGLDH